MNDIVYVSMAFLIAFQYSNEFMLRFVEFRIYLFGKLQRNWHNVQSAERLPCCRVPWKPGGLDPESEEHEAYLSKFREIVSAKLQSLINRSLEEEPEIKARNKTVQVSHSSAALFYKNFSHDFIFKMHCMEIRKNLLFWFILC